MIDTSSWSTAFPGLLMAFAFGYLCGSIPFGLILTKLAGLGDVRSIGSGNIGATNVLRTGNKTLAALTLLGDMMKGTFAVFLAIIGGAEATILAGLGAFLGHLFPIWLGFKGGKGIATYVGLTLAFSWLAVSWWPLLVFAAVWFSIAAITRYSSLAALVATAATPVVFYIIEAPRLALLFAVLTLLAWVMHRTNIKRLLSGTEGKIGAKG